MLSPQTPPPTANANNRRNREQDTCFFCKLKGHWASHCPSKSPTTPPVQAHHKQSKIFLEINGRRYQRCLVCPNCGLPCCSLVSPAPAPAPARPYFRCSSKSGKKCFFKWGDEVKSEQLVNVPICSCGAAPCRLTTPTTGPFAGLPLFICPIQKGQGACSFSQPLNAEVVMLNTVVVEELNSLRSTLTSCDDSNPKKSSLLDEGDSLEIEAIDASTPSCHENAAVSLHVKRGNEMLVLIEEHEGASSELQKHSKRLRHGPPENDSSLGDSATGCVDDLLPELHELSLEDLTMIVQLENNFRHVESPKEMSIVDIPPQAFYSCSSAPSTKSSPKLFTTAAKQNIGVQLHDWLGRLAFSPSRSLINPAPKPYFCCIFPSFDPIYASEHLNRGCVEEASGVVSECPLFPDQDDPSNHVLWKPCSQSDPEVVKGNFMTTTISEGFAQLAIDLQNKLLSRLDSMDFHDYESMTQAATATFDALKQLKMDYGPLCAKVKDFINCALSLVRIEGSIVREQASHKQVAENCCREKIQLDGISRAYAKAETDLEASRKQLQSLGEEASRLRDALFHVEAELICCEAENQSLKSQYIQWCEKLLASERRVEVACTEADEAAKVCQMREEEKQVAEAAFKKAKRMLLLA